MKRFLSCLVVCCCAVWARADWRTTLTEEAVQRKRDDRIFITIDRALENEVLAVTEDAPYLHLYTTGLLAEGYWGFQRHSSENDAELPDLKVPSQRWTQTQVSNLLKQRITEDLKHAHLFAQQPWERFPMLQNSTATRWPNQSVLYALISISSIAFWEKTEEVAFLQQMLSIAKEVDDEMLEGIVSMSLIYKLDEYKAESWDEFLRKRIIALRESKAWPKEMQARLWNAEAYTYGMPSNDGNDENWARKMVCLNQVVQLTQFDNLKKDALEAMKLLRQAEVRVMRNSSVIHPHHRKVELLYRNVTKITIAHAKEKAKPLKTYTLPAPKHPYAWAQTEIELPELPLGDVELVVSAQGNVRDNPFEETIEFKVATFTVGIVYHLGVGYFYVADSADGTPLGAVEIAYADQVLKTDANGLAAFSLPMQEEACVRETERVTFRARGEALDVVFAALPIHYARKEAPQVAPALFTDRAVYRPGETIGWEVLLQQINEQTRCYQSVPNAKGRLEIVASNQQGETTLFTQELVASARGTASGEVAVPADFSGDVNFMWNGGFVKGVSVYEFRASTFQVNVESTSQGKPLTEPVTFCVRAVDLSGVPLAGAEVKWKLNAVYEESGVGVLNAAGEYEVKIRLPEEALAEKTAWVGTLFATVIATNGESESVQEYFVLPYYGYNVYVDVLNEDWLIEGQPARVEISCEPVCDVKGEIDIYATVEDESVEGDKKPFKTIPFEKPGVFEVELPAGFYTFRVRAGEETHETWDIAVLPQTRDAARLRLNPYNDGYLTVNKKMCGCAEIGKTLQCYALLRGEGEVFWTILSQKGIAPPQRLETPFFEVPVTADLREGFSILAFTFDQGQFRVIEQSVNVHSFTELKVEATRFAEEAMPGSEQTWEIAVDDPSAELIVTCYDQALDAFMFMEQNWLQQRPKSAVYWQRSYRELFGEVSCWFTERLPVEEEAVYESDDCGCAELCMEGAEVPSQDGHGGVMMAKRAVSRNGTGVNGCVAADLQRAEVLSMPRERSDFRMTAVWLPEKRLEEGKARFTFTLPDSTTTWRLMVYAFTPDGRTGFLTRECVARQQVMLKPYLPRNFDVDNQEALNVRVDNTTDADIETTLTPDGARAQNNP